MLATLSLPTYSGHSAPERKCHKSNRRAKHFAFSGQSALSPRQAFLHEAQPDGLRLV